jgi:hypothetical protein
MNVSYVVCHERASSVVSVYRVYFVSFDNVLLWVCEVQCNRQGRRFTLGYLCVLFVGDMIESQSRRIIG